MPRSLLHLVASTHPLNFFPVQVTRPQDKPLLSVVQKAGSTPDAPLPPPSAHPHSHLPVPDPFQPDLPSSPPRPSGAPATVPPANGASERPLAYHATALSNTAPATTGPAPHELQEKSSSLSTCDPTSNFFDKEGLTPHNARERKTTTPLEKTGATSQRQTSALTALARGNTPSWLLRAKTNPPTPQAYLGAEKLAREGSASPAGVAPSTCSPSWPTPAIWQKEYPNTPLPRPAPDSNSPDSPPRSG